MVESKLDKFRKALACRLTEPLMKSLAKTGISPDVLTWTGFALMVAAAGLLAYGYFFRGGIAVLVSSPFDILDGALARYKNRVTPFGGILDSTLDRLAEALLFLGILINYDITNMPVGCLVLVYAALTGSFLVSYTRARAEGLNIKCQVGIGTRAERIVLLVLGLLFNQVPTALAVIFVLSTITVCQRLIYTYQQTRK